MGLIKKWNGTAWVESPLMRWNGTSWERAKVYTWDGSAWILLQGVLTTATYNATSYQTRVWSGAKHYLRTISNPSSAYSSHVGFYGDDDSLAYVTFDFPAIYTALQGKIPVNLDVLATMSGCDVATTMTVLPTLIYSDSANFDISIGLGYSALPTPIPDGSVKTLASGASGASPIANSYYNSRYPMAIMLDSMNDDPYSYATGAFFNNVQLILTYET